MLWTGLGRLGFGLEPCSDFRRLRREMSRLLDGLAQNGPAEYPAVSVWRTEDGVAVTAEVPGVDPKELDISVIGNTLTIRGRRQPDELAEGEEHLRHERGHGEFVRTLQLPYDVEAGQVAAVCENGVLRVNCPRADADKPRRIAVSTH
jgi:HSP20 family protein